MSDWNEKYFEQKYEEWRIMLGEWHEDLRSTEELEALEAELKPLFDYCIKRINPLEICNLCILCEVKA
jgi:hypothetical protein